MKIARKLFALALALCMVCMLSVTAFADDNTQTPAQYTENKGQTNEKVHTDASSVTIKKSYKLIGAGTSPAETFTLESVSSSVSDSEATSAPALGNITGAAYTTTDGASANGNVKDITINLPEYTQVGIYTYILKESNGTTAGVSYRPESDTIKLVVTVVNADDGTNKVRVAAVHTEANSAGKSDTFENTYSAGTLKVSKTVTGNLGDKNKYFEFKVTLTGVTGKTYGDSYAVSGGSNTSNPTSIEIGEETTFYLKDGETISIKNLPYGVTYTVTETAAEGYTTSKTGDTGSINAAEQTAAFTNNKEGTVDTGVTLDSLPYVMILAVAAVGCIALVMKKRYTV